MWIEPNGVVKIIQNVDLDNKYDNTIYFANRTAQYNYFNSKVKYTYPKITYQRVKRNSMRVEINAENLYDCNYLMFQNTSFGNRWFYAFITKVEYVANMVSEIQYEIDEMQTWFYDCTMGMCLIDREHSVYDNLYSNLIEEQLELGPYHNSEYEFPHDALGVPYFNEMSIVFGCTFYWDYDTSQWVEYGVNDSGGIVSALNYMVFPMTSDGIIKANTFIDNVTQDQKSDGIVTAYLMPTYFANLMTVPLPEPDQIVRRMSGTTFQQAQFMDYTGTFDSGKVGSYTPKNKKLLSYPFKFLHATDFHGQDAEYRYEFFGGQQNQFGFRFTMGMTPEPSMLVTPTNYMGNSANYNEIFVVKCYPMVGYDIDGFKMWLAQNWGSLITAGVGSIGGVVGNTNIPPYSVSEFGNVSGGLAGATYSGGLAPVALAFGTMMQVAQHTKMASYAKNNPTADAQWVGGLRGFAYCDMHITVNYAKRIDDYFDMFGYKTNEIKVPNINSRPHWNFIRTVDANIFGNVPADSLRQIKDIFNRGITFWKNGDNIGNYSLDNRPV